MGEGLLVGGKIEQPLRVKIGHEIMDQVVAKFRLQLAVDRLVVEIEVLEQVDHRAHLGGTGARGFEIALWQSPGGGQNGQEDSAHGGSAVQSREGSERGHHWFVGKGGRPICFKTQYPPNRYLIHSINCHTTVKTGNPTE